MTSPCWPNVFWLDKRVTRTAMKTVVNKPLHKYSVSAGNVEVKCLVTVMETVKLRYKVRTAKAVAMLICCIRECLCV